MSVVLVAIGGVAGVLARYGITRATLHSDALIWSTVAINVVGSFFLGLLVADDLALARHARRGRDRLPRRLHDVLDLLGADRARGRWRPPGTAIAYLVASVAGGIAAAAAGYALGRAVT